jgi:hypothetical protein
LPFYSHAASFDNPLSKIIAAVMRIAIERANARRAPISIGLSKNPKVAIQKNENPEARLCVSRAAGLCEEGMLRQTLRS